MLNFKSSLVLIFLVVCIWPSFSTADTRKPKNKAPLVEKKMDTLRDIWPPSFDELLDHRLPDLVDLRVASYFPRMNIQESENSYHVEAEVPGVKKEEIEIKLKDDYLVISGEKKSMHEETKNQYRRIERASGSFYRAVSIPRNIDKDKVTAELKDGILKVDIAKSKNGPESVEKKILIK